MKKIEKIKFAYGAHPAVTVGKHSFVNKMESHLKI